MMILVREDEDDNDRAFDDGGDDNGALDDDGDNGGALDDDGDNGGAYYNNDGGDSDAKTRRGERRSNLGRRQSAPSALR